MKERRQIYDQVTELMQRIRNGKLSTYPQARVRGRWAGTRCG